MVAIPQTPDDVHKLEQLTGVSITSLAGLKRALQKNFQEAVDIGIVGIKTIIAYSREILFQEVEEQAAARDFDSLMRGDSIGFPYQEKLSVLAKVFANVFVDFSWMYVVSPEVSRRAMSEYLETVPSNKILGFGGDFIYAELAYAHAKMARRAVAQVLAAKVADGYCSETKALELGRRILYGNAAALGVYKREQTTRFNARKLSL